MSTKAGPRSRAPMYARALRLRHMRPGGFVCFLLFEAVIAVAMLLALAEQVSWWAVVALPAAVAAMVKINDLVLGVTAPARGSRGSRRGAPAGDQADVRGGARGRVRALASIRTVAPAMSPDLVSFSEYLAGGDVSEYLAGAGGDVRPAVPAARQEAATTVEAADTDLREATGTTYRSRAARARRAARRTAEDEETRPVGVSRILLASPDRVGTSGEVPSSPGVGSGGGGSAGGGSAGVGSGGVGSGGVGSGGTGLAGPGPGGSGEDGASPGGVRPRGADPDGTGVGGAGPGGAGPGGAGPGGAGPGAPGPGDADPGGEAGRAEPGDPAGESSPGERATPNSFPGRGRAGGQGGGRHTRHSYEDDARQRGGNLNQGRFA